MAEYVLALEALDDTSVELVGGKAAHLGELTRLPGVAVPPGFCLPTTAYERALADDPTVAELLGRLERGPVGQAGHLAGPLRAAIVALTVPADVVDAVRAALARLGAGDAYAVRSSAAVEDRPQASFAGQHDSFLGVVGAEAVLEHLKACWASLFSDRAISYRSRKGLSHNGYRMAVLVQRMVPARAAGVVFTADPVTGDRGLTRVEAAAGLGDGLAAGRVDPQVWTVRGRSAADASITVTAPVASGDGPGDAGRTGQAPALLTDAQVLDLTQLCRRIEAHFGRPQDVEWCLADDGFRIVQSRPISALFPVPARVAGESGTRVYVSVGHQQMMTDPIRPLGLSFWQLTSRAPMRTAGGRLFVDVTGPLTDPNSREALLEALGRSDPLIGDALRTLLGRGDVLTPPAAAAERPESGPARWALNRPVPAVEPDAGLVAELVAQAEAGLAAATRALADRDGPALLQAVRADLEQLRQVLFDPRSLAVITAGLDAGRWLEETLSSWLGEQVRVDVLSQSVPGDVSAQMGLALLDVADAVRPHPAVLDLLRRVPGQDLLDALPALPGGAAARAAIRAFLDRYGMRCVGEIDLTRPRWSERPGDLLPALLADVDAFAPGEAARRLERGRRRAAGYEQELLTRVRALPDGAARAAQVAHQVGRLRTLSGYREYPKYHLVSRYQLYRTAILGEAERLVRDGVLPEREDVFSLSLPELEQVVGSGRVGRGLIVRRKQEQACFEALTPPRVLTSDGEVFSGAYRRGDVPAGALVGLPVCAGTVEGPARVVTDLALATLEPGDILVTTFTDPGWTAVFPAAAALVTEVGGLMTHGAVVAREYGLPTVVGVQHATRLIRDRQRIRVHGSQGYVELLGPAPAADPLTPPG